MKMPEIPSIRLNGHFLLVNYIYSSTLIGIFSGAVTYHLGVDILLFYFILISNLWLIGFLVEINQIPGWLIALTGYLAFSGIYGITHETDSVSLFAKQFVGIVVSATYFYYFFKLPDNSIYKSFMTYAKLSYRVCQIGLPLWCVVSLLQGSPVRLQSISSEPAAFCTLVLPAYYWYAEQYLVLRKNAKEFYVFTFAVILSGSSLGYISAIFGVFLMLSRRKRLLVAAPIVLALLISSIYIASSDFRLRVDDTLGALVSNDLSGVNLSTYAVVSNLIVTEKVFEDSPILGHGLGSHPISYEKYIGAVEGIDDANLEWLGYNSTDAASMTLRSISELGLVGYSGILLFLWYFHVSGSGIHATISNAMLTTFFLKLIRGGLYFPPEQFFFILIYVINYRDSKRDLVDSASSLSQIRYEISKLRLPV